LSKGLSAKQLGRGQGTLMAALVALNTPQTLWRSYTATIAVCC
jgi:hypothetical protein